MMCIDVVIPTSKNVIDSHYSICYTVRSILNQSYQPQNIYIVENVFDTGVFDIISLQFGSLVQVINGSEKSNNISFARNLGVSKGNSDIIIFMDDDVIIGYHNYFKDIAEIMSYNDFCCGARRYWISTEWYKYLSLDFQMNHNLQILKAKSFLPHSIERTTGNRNCSEFTYIGNFGAVKRKIFYAIGGFDEQYEGWTYQDTDLMMRLCSKQYNYEILAYNNMFCYHLGHPADKQYYRKINKEKYMKKQIEFNLKFNHNNFFGRFDDDTVAVVTPLSI